MKICQLNVNCSSKNQVFRQNWFTCVVKTGFDLPTCGREGIKKTLWFSLLTSSLVCRILTKKITNAVFGDLYHFTP